MVQPECIVRGVKKWTSGPSRPRLPITPNLLEQMRREWFSVQRPHDTLMLQAAASLCFLGFLRLGEVVIPLDASFDPEVHLTASDVSVDSHTSPSYVAVRIKTSKINPFRQGVTIYLLGKTDGYICPVAAILSYIVKRDSSLGPLFYHGCFGHSQKWS